MTSRASEWLDAGAEFDWAPTEMRHTDRARIFHAEFGDPEAPLIVLVHGFPTSSIDWYDVAPLLTDRFRVGVVDFPGFGFSGKPPGETYTLRQDAALLGFYLEEVLGAERGAVVAHDRGDSVSLAFLERCAATPGSFEPTNLVLSNANLFLPLSSLTRFQHLMLDPATAPAVIEQLTPELLAAGMGDSTFTPKRRSDDPAIIALAETFALEDGVAAMHHTIQYLVERSEHEVGWLELLAASSVPTTLVWGLQDTVSPLRVAARIWDDYLSISPRANAFWLLPRANHYLQHDQPAEFAEVVGLAIEGGGPDDPGALSDALAAPVLIDRSRAALRPASEVIAPQTPA